MSTSHATFKQTHAITMAVICLIAVGMLVALITNTLYAEAPLPVAATIQQGIMLFSMLFGIFAIGPMPGYHNNTTEDINDAARGVIALCLFTIPVTLLAVLMVAFFEGAGPAGDDVAQVILQTLVVAGVLVATPCMRSANTRQHDTNQ